MDLQVEQALLDLNDLKSEAVKSSAASNSQRPPMTSTTAEGSGGMGMAASSEGWRRNT